MVGRRVRRAAARPTARSSRRCRCRTASSREVDASAARVGDLGAGARAARGWRRRRRRRPACRRPVCVERAQRFRDEHVDDGVLESARDVRLRASGSVADRRRRRSARASTAVLRPRKLKSRSPRVEHRPRQLDRAGRPCSASARQRRPAGIRQAQQLARSCRRLRRRRRRAFRRAAGSGRRRRPRTAGVWPPDTSSATNGNSGAGVAEQRRQQVAFHVMDADRRHAERPSRARCATLAPTSSAPASPGPCV